MSIRSRLRSRFGRQSERQTIQSPPPRAVEGIPREDAQVTNPLVTMFGSRANLTSSLNMIPRKRVLFDIDAESLQRFPLQTLLGHLDSISPEASMALWNTLRLTGTPEISVTDIKGKFNQAAYDYILSVRDNAFAELGGFDVFVNQLTQTTYVQGAAAGEVVLEENLRDVRAIVPVDPTTIDFFVVQDPVTKIIRYVPKQRQTGWVTLDKNGFFYLPLDSNIGSPYGNSPILTFLQVVFADLKLLSNLDKYMHNQGWPRLHIKILEEVLMRGLPAGIANNPKKIVDYINLQTEAVAAKFRSLKADDSFTTSDAVKVDPFGTGDKLGGAPLVMEKLLRRKVANALKQLSLFLNYQEGTTETYGTLQWKMQVLSIEAVRKVIAGILNRILTYVLNAQGIQGWVTCEYEAIPLVTKKEDAEAGMAEARRVTYLRDAGYISHDEAAQMLLDKDKASGPEVPMETKGAGMLPEVMSRDLPADRALVKTEKSGMSHINLYRLLDKERSYRRQLHAAYRDMMAQIKKAVEKIEVAK